MVAFGDAEAAVAAILRANPAVMALGATVATDLIGYRIPARWLRVTRTGGVPTWWSRMDNPVIDVDAYGANKAQALDLADAARQAVFAARGVYSGHGLRLYDVVDVKGLAWTPDTLNPASARYSLTLGLVTVSTFTSSALSAPLGSLLGHINGSVT